MLNFCQPIRDSRTNVNGGVGDVRSRLLQKTEPGNDWVGKSADFVLACKQKSRASPWPFLCTIFDVLDEWAKRIVEHDEWEALRARKRAIRTIRW